MELLLRLETDQTAPLYQQVVAQVRELIIAGRLRPGSKMPSGRELAETYGIARNTATLAYQQLVSEGYLEARERSGYYVNADLPDHALRASVLAAQPPAPAPGGRLSTWAQAVIQTEPNRPGELLPYDFRQRFPIWGAFPHAEWRRHLVQALEAGGPELLEYGDPAGYGPLRQAVAAHAGQSRGAVCEPHQVIITTGARQGFDLLIRTLLEPGDAVVVEEPGYPTVRHMLDAHGARIIPVPVDDHGLQVERLPEAGGVRMLLVTPSHQYPTGGALDLARRMALLGWARRHGALVVEDDYDGEFRHEGRPLQALQGLDGGGNVAYVGSFAKSLAPALRLGYLILPAPLVRPVEVARYWTDLQASTPLQAALHTFMAGGGLERHLRRVRQVVRRRRDAFLRAVEHHLPGAVVGPAGAGMHLMLTLPEVSDEVALLRRAREMGLGLQTAAPCYAQGAVSGRFLFWYAHLEEERAEEGLRRLATLLR